MPKNPSSKRIVFAVDLGGTHLRAALVDDTGKILKQHKQDTPKGDSADCIIDALVQVAERWGCNELPVVAVSIMVPGAVDCDESSCRASAKPSFVSQLPIKS